MLFDGLIKNKNTPCALCAGTFFLLLVGSHARGGRFRSIIQAMPQWIIVGCHTWLVRSHLSKVKY